MISFLKDRRIEPPLPEHISSDGPTLDADRRSSSFETTVPVSPPTAQGPSAGDYQTDSHAFRLAELCSELVRVEAIFGVFASLLLLLLVRGFVSLAQHRHGQVWPFVVLLAVATSYEMVWLKFIRRALHRSMSISQASWLLNIALECLLPTAALFLAVSTPLIGPQRVLASPVVLAYVLFIILSTLHLSPALSRLAGAFSAAGYTAVAIYIFVFFPQVTATDRMVTYSTAFSFAVLLLIAGLAAGAVASQIRAHVVAALKDAENRAKIASMKRDLDLARSIQQGLLPKTPPEIPGFDVAAWNQPADETGGDYFDWQELAGGRVAITIADVSGHGIGPAVAMAACRAYARAGLATEPHLQSFLAHLNGLLHQDLPSGKFVTLAAGILSPDNASLRLISAGHGPMLFYSSENDRFSSYDAQGPPLGILQGVTYRAPQAVEFAPGDILVLATDGFTEWSNSDGEEFGQDRIENVIREHRHMPAEKIISEMHSAVLKFAGSTPQPDDLTALIVKRLSLTGI